ncbi:DNA polymerase [Ovoidimarina sediminis]|uniref:DNA polymerase n=1 Tax=Ovoidimarina sediminis TaxID=3079856 RepID=UPI002909C40D|nr:DNA polymerase [Rhodophyticola sp. MJ-SS7]MDU8946445.1 DNA polymerase [Rhodophyticola sp. MJ-SS7]
MPYEQELTPTLKSENFHPRAKDPDQYLIIGFDTEYQRDVVELPSGKAELRNIVLSYQFSCRIVTTENEGEEPCWSGIRLPPGPNDEDRFSLEEFVGHAIRAGFEEHPDLVMPSDIYLVAHFNRADVPGFSDFKDEKTRRALNLENVRGSYVNVKKDIPISLKDDDTDEAIDLSVRIRDTITLAPTGAQSLEKLGGILGFEKIKLSDDRKEEQHFKENMQDFLKSNWNLFREYAIRDAEICAQYSLKMIRLNREKTDKFKLPITLTSIGVDLIREYWKENGVDPLEIVGKEECVDRYWSKKNSRYQTSKRVVSIKNLFWNEDFFTECYHGGRNEQFWFGPAPEGVWYDYDLTSAYPSAMALIGVPDWSTIRPIKNTEELLNGDLRPNSLAFANVDFEFPESVRYPVLPVRTENGLIFPRRGNSSTHISEILLAKELGAKITLVEGRRIDSVTAEIRAGLPHEFNRVFQGFAKRCIEERAKYPKKTLNNLFWKELVNSTYGKTAQGLRERRIYDLRDGDTKRLGPSKITNPVFASFITAFCRAVLGEIMNALPETVKVFSVTTDGFLTTATEEDMLYAPGFLSGMYRASRHLLAGPVPEGQPPRPIYEVKHVIRQPLGWRTRGQATLRPSQKQDWEDTNWDLLGSKVEPTEDDMLVLAKGGIKLNRLLSKPEQNNEVVELFLNRKPSDTQTLTLGRGIREMYEGGLDFTNKELTERLSMEFDWKRRPESAGMFSVKFGDTDERKHLVFTTKPWDSVDQFNTVRRIWAEYNKNAPHCLKTLEDYEAFAVFFEGKLAADGPAGKYLRRTDGIRKRIRQELIVAHRHRKAGTHEVKAHAFGNTNIFPDKKKIKAKDLADLLSDGLKLPCSVDDVNNARKKKTFTPHQVPRTNDAEVILRKARRYLFPALEIDEFLTSKAEFTLSVGKL